MDDQANKRQKLERFLVKDPWERKLCGLGVPKLFWKPDLSKLKFEAVPVGPDKLSGAAQRQWLKALAKEIIVSPPLVVMTSAPTDNGALYLACYLTYYFMSKGKSAAVLNTADGRPPMLDSFPYVVIIHNILSDASVDRMQTVRDLLSQFVNSFKIVVVVNESDPYKWCRHRLGKNPTMVFKVADIAGVL